MYKSRAFADSSIYRAFKVLSPSDKNKLLRITGLQIVMGALDLLGVLAVGILGALSVTGLQSSKPDSRISDALRVLHIQDLPLQSQMLILGVSAAILLIGRTVLSIFFTRRILFFLSRRGAKISSDLVSRLLSQPLLTVQSRTTQETVYSLTTGVERIVLQVLATAVVCRFFPFTCVNTWIISRRSKNSVHHTHSFFLGRIFSL